jgi:hypothetical protein
MKTKALRNPIIGLILFGWLHLHAQDPLTVGLVAHYPFNGNANDTSGNGHHAVLMGSGMQLTNGVGNIPNSAFRGVVAGNTNNLAASGVNLSNSSLSITLWFRKDYQPFTIDHGSILTLGTESSQGKQLHIRPYYSGVQFRFSFFNDDFDVSSPVGNGEWTHIACTYDNATRERRIYFDGVLIATNVAVRGYTGTGDLLMIPAGLGTAPAGLIDNVRIYDRTLSAYEVAQVFLQEIAPALSSGLVAYYPFNGNANDESGNGNQGTAVGISLTNDRFGFGNRCYDFNGAGYISINNSLLLNNATSATISSWFLRKASSTTGFIVGAGDSRAGFDPFALVITPSLQIQSQFTDTALSPSNPDQGLGYSSGAGAVQSNTWYHIAQVFESAGSTSVYRLYLNGSLFSESNYSHSQRIFYDQPMPVQIGALTSFADSRFVGLIDDVRFYNRALSGSEIAAMYALESGPAINLIKAVKPAFERLILSNSYQLQLSGDLVTWTNHGTPFVATNSSMVYPQYWDVDNWGQLFFRLQVAP